MNLTARGALCCYCLVAWLTAAGVPARAQDNPAAKDAPAANTPAPAAAAQRHRRLAPGVMVPVDPQRRTAETFSRHDIVELVAVDPNFDWAKDVAFRRDIWTLEFKFKPMRMIWVDIPQPNGLMQRRLVWYLVYSVTNTGKIMHPVAEESGTYKVEMVDRPVRFIPKIVLSSRDSDKAYPDQVLPVAVAEITVREDRARRFHNTAEMCREIGVGETAWGVATWLGGDTSNGDGIDPRINRFSVYITGLTNAYRWKDEPGLYKPGDPIGKGRTLQLKTLQLNFWRAADEYYQHEKEIRLGIPGELDYQWVWR